MQRQTKSIVRNYEENAVEDTIRRRSFLALATTAGCCLRCRQLAVLLWFSSGLCRHNSFLLSWNSWENWTETHRVSFLASLWAPVVLLPILCSLLNVTNMMGLKRVMFCVCLHVCMQQSQLSSLWSAKSTFSRYEQFFLLCEMYRLQCSGRRKRWILSETGCWRTAEALKAFYCLCAVGHGENT